MSYWDDSTKAANSPEYVDPDPLPPGIHWTRIARANSYQKEGDELPTVVLNFVELEPPLDEDGKKMLPREHAHFEKFTTSPQRMQYVKATLKALGASDEVRADSEKMHDFLVDTPTKCGKYHFQIEISETEGSRGRIFLNAEILEMKPAGKDPGVSQPAAGKSWDQWSSTKKKNEADDDVSF